MKGHQDLRVWQKAVDLVVDIYKATETFPKTEIYGLTSSCAGAAVSVPSTIAEGHALKQTQAYGRHLAIACGLLAELETQLEIARRLGFIDETSRSNLVKQTGEIGRMLAGLRTSRGLTLGPGPES